MRPSIGTKNTEIKSIVVRWKKFKIVRKRKSKAK